MKWWQKIGINAIVFMAISGLMDGFHISSVWTAFVAAMVFGLLNLFVKPIVVILSLPLNCLTMGLFYFVINGMMISMTSFFVSGFEVDSFWVAFFVAMILSVVNSLLVADEY